MTLRTLVLGLVLALGSAIEMPAEAGTRVIIISCDGLRPDAITDAIAPNMRQLIRSGASADEALCDLPAVTLPNHASMLTGLTARRHGLLLNTELPGTIPQPTVFDFACEAGLRGAFLVSKSKLLFLASPDVLETTVYESDPAELIDRLLPLIVPAGPDLIFLHLREPDSTGHRAGWMSPAYLDAVTAMDTLVGRVMDAIQIDADTPTYLILTADHGGEGTTHFLNEPSVRRIPWIVTGPGIDPATPLPGVVSTTDTAATALYLLGVELPAGLDGVAWTELRSPPAQARAPVVPWVGPPCFVLTLPLLTLLAIVSRHRSRLEITH